MFSLIGADVATFISTANDQVAAIYAVPVAVMAAFWGGRKLLGLARSFFGV